MYTRNFVLSTKNSPLYILKILLLIKYYFRIIIIKNKNKMNKTEVTLRISEKSGIKQDDARKVLDAFEEVLSDRLFYCISKAFYKTYSMTNCTKNKNSK